MEIIALCLYPEGRLFRGNTDDGDAYAAVRRFAAAILIRMRVDELLYLSFRRSPDAARSGRPKGDPDIPFIFTFFAL